jgi:DNA-binding transcriptional MerR regulator
MIETKIHHLPRLGLASAMRLYGLTARALRFYEERGLIEARRDRLNARFYDPEARRRLDWIVPLRKAGVPLEEIREVLRAEDEDGRGQEHALRAVARRQAELETQLAEAKQALQSLAARPAAEPRRLAVARL